MAILIDMFVCVSSPVHITQLGVYIDYTSYTGMHTQLGVYIDYNSQNNVHRLH